jgi:flagellar hook-associated protein 3 FlgL
VDFDLSTPGKKNIATTLTDMFNALSAGGGFTPGLKSSINDAMVQITNATEQMAIVQSSLGGRLNVTESVMSSNGEINIASLKTRADLAELDFTTGITDLMQEEAALEAAQATFGRISRLTLFDHIR